MPLYEYVCDDCGTDFERLVRRSDDSSFPDCPSCGLPHVTKKLSTFSAPQGSSNGGRQAAVSCDAMPQGGCCGSGFCSTSYD